MYCTGGNTTDPIWRVLASSGGISSWTLLKPQHSNPKPNPLANQLWCIDFLTPPTPLIILLYIVLPPGQTCHSKDGGSCIFRWPVMGRDCVGELGWQYGTGLKSHFTVTNWCTGRGWPVNCMTVISARWESKHAIPNTVKVVYSVGQLWEEIEWA